MADPTMSSRMQALQFASRRPNTYMQRSTYFRRAGDPEVCDFTFGNPNEMPMPEYVEALQRAVVPQSKDWFAYKWSEPASQQIVAASLREKFDLPFEPADIAMTTGGAGAIAVALTAILEPGDEVIFNLPPWFGYEGTVVHTGGVPVKVPVLRDTFDLDIDAIEAAITAKTRMVIINSPCNPTGKIYPPATLERLATVLSAASERNGRTVYLLSDEAYNRIVFDGNQFHTPLEFYPDALLAYSYGKTLLAPGQRIGYLALPPTMTNREPMREAIMAAQIFQGFGFPNALLQHALADLDKLCIDMTHMHRKRDLLVGALREIGYQVHVPEGTFYLLPQSPWEDDWAFVDLLEQLDVFVLPGEILEFSGFFRISLTANDDMIERSLPRFRAAFEQARQSGNPNRAVAAGG
jgi:aspartate aminotransferase